MARPKKVDGLTSRIDSNGRPRHRILIRTTDANGHPIVVDQMMPVGTSKTDAVQALEQIKRDIAAGEFRRARRARTSKVASAPSGGNASTLREAWDEYLAIMAGTGWHRDLCSIARTWCETMGGDTSVAKINADLAETFKARRRGTVAPATVNRALGAFKAMASRAAKARWRWMPPGIARSIADVDLETEAAQRVRHLTDAERSAIGAVVDGARSAPARRVYVVAAETGMRLGEVLGLRKSDVDYTRNTITIARTVARKSPPGVFRQPKGNKPRAVPMTPTLRAELAAAVVGEDGPLCPTTGGTWYTIEGYSHTFGAMVKRAKVADFHFHDVRHDWATRSLAGGAPIEVISQQLGHGDLSITLKRYAHTQIDTLQLWAERLPATTGEATKRLRERHGMPAEASASGYFVGTASTAPKLALVK